jgi:uncharacterized protein YcfJ
MKTLLLHSTLFLAFAAAGSAAAQDYGSRSERGPRDETRRSDVARVLGVERLSSGRDPYQRQECWDERSDRRDGEYYRDESGRLYRGDGRDKSTRTLIGAVIGGAIGNQVGSGSGRTAATVAGAVAGAAVARNDGRRDEPSYDRYRDEGGREFRCRALEDDQRRGGRDLFRVSYQYAGQNYVAMTDVHPGRSLRVVVDVRPRDEARGNR